MRCSLLILAGVASGLATTALAEDFSLPSDSPAISVTIPDAWQPQDSPIGLIGHTDAPDQTNLFLNVVDKGSVSADFQAEVERLRALGIVLEPAKETKFDEQINGMPYLWSMFDTTYEGNPEKYSFGVLEISENSMLEITFLCNQAGYDNKSYVVTDVVKSVRKQ